MATHAEAKAAKFRERALSLERYAANCRLGAEGEAALDSVLERLIDRGWHPLPDRRSRRGGNIDELFVGPAGVAVLDAKNWSYPLTIRGDRLRTGKFPKDRELEHVVQLVDEVKEVLRRSSLGPVAVQGFMTLCGDADRSRAPVKVNGIWICGLDVVAQGFSNLPVAHAPRDVEMIASVIERGFPPILRSKTVHSQSDVEYDLRYWSGVEIVRLLDALGRQGLPYRWDSSELLLTVAGRFENVVNGLVASGSDP